MFTDFQNAARTGFALQFPKIDSACMGRGDGWLFIERPDGVAELLNITDLSDKGIAGLVIDKQAVAWALAWDCDHFDPDSGDMVAVVCDPAAKAQFLYYPYLIDHERRLYVSRAHTLLRGNHRLDIAIQRLDRIHFHLPAEQADRLCCRKGVADVQG
jgi:hypothetical protein